MNGVGTEHRWRPLAGWLVLSLMVLALAASGTAHAEVRATSFGGPGGVTFSQTCGEDVLIGLRLRSGDWLDNIDLICAPLDRDGRLGRTFEMPPEAYAAGVKGFGGGGGRAIPIVVCPPGQFVRGIEGTTFLQVETVNVIQATSKHFVADVSLWCGTAQGPERVLVRSDWRARGTEDERFFSAARGPMYECPTATLGVGLHGQAGDYVDRVGLICNGHAALAPITPPQTGVAGADRSGTGLLIYEDVGYGGVSLNVTSALTTLARNGWDNRISSIRVMSGAWKLCEDADFQGQCITLTADRDNLVPAGWNDRISSIVQVEAPEPPSPRIRRR